GNNADNVLRGRGGADVLSGGAGLDTADYKDAPAGLTADLATPASNTGDAAGDSYSSIENLQGSNFDDTLNGDAGNNVLTGLDGNDTLNGRAGADTMIGGAGNDSYTLDNAGDTVTENANEGIDT